jgi:integrase/recombinase XerD
MKPREGLPSDSDLCGLIALAARYLEHLGVHNYSPRTIGTAKNALALFSSWCNERGIASPGEISRSVVERYQRWLFHYRRPSGKPLAFATQRNRLVHVKGFFHWLTRERYLLYNPASELEMPKVHRHLPQPLTMEEAEEVLRQPDLSQPLGVRDRAMLETFYSTGVRRSELMGLDLWDLDAERGWLTVRQGKGGKDRVVPIGERAVAWVRKYLDEVRPLFVVDPEERALFLSSRGNRISEDLSNLVRKYLEQAGVRRQGGCHLFRHTMATLLLEGGADIRAIQEMLGHAKLENTQIYTQVSIHQLKRIHEAAHPARMRRTESDSEASVRIGDDEPSSASVESG